MNYDYIIELINIYRELCKIEFNDGNYKDLNNLNQFKDYIELLKSYNE